MNGEPNKSKHCGSRFKVSISILVSAAGFWCNIRNIGHCVSVVYAISAPVWLYRQYRYWSCVFRRYFEPCYKIL